MRVQLASTAPQHPAPQVLGIALTADRQFIAGSTVVCAACASASVERDDALRIPNDLFPASLQDSNSPGRSSARK
ncbi:1,4-dihydroxy-2-naphthoate octaprenyltransferase [Anopheles sinensis]|uniref:1,4-dihydroxy-2-naphthoate octaprenyltransferase n=1 Tax=Anopheles sinensis TaxID=74873 RepID=A0A084WJE7_ANOSI|nr:1,4-dihydroxy-2-naphthoate octaprenyltransferase [Anopheles sinensis]